MDANSRWDGGQTNMRGIVLERQGKKVTVELILPFSRHQCLPQLARGLEVNRECWTQLSLLLVTCFIHHDWDAATVAVAAAGWQPQRK